MSVSYFVSEHVVQLYAFYVRSKPNHCRSQLTQVIFGIIQRQIRSRVKACIKRNTADGELPIIAISLLCNTPKPNAGTPEVASCDELKKSRSRAFIS